MGIDDVLKTTFGFQTFRPGQREAIEQILNHGRVLCVQPTGHGKSLLYQLPTCLLSGLTLVISPLLALMRDQMLHLNERFNIPAAAINTDQTEEENANAKRAAAEGRVKILFLAPEQLDHVDRFAFLLSLTVSLVVVDEAHCISVWGHDFRPSYRLIVQFLSALAIKNSEVRVLGLTATANQTVEDDITKQLNFSQKSMVVMRETLDRPNISLSVLKRHGAPAKLAACAEVLAASNGCGLIYCATRDSVSLVADFLQTQSFDVAPYHAGMDFETKKRLQSEFLADRYKALVSTNALGMGIDKGNLRFVIHFDVPGSITAYYQEVGRSGRDGLPAQGVLLFDPSDRRVHEYFIESALPTPEDFAEVLRIIRSETPPPTLTIIKRVSGLHPTRVTIVIAELVEQGFAAKKSLDGSQVYVAGASDGLPDMSRYIHQQIVKKDELQKMLAYADQATGCRMAFLRRSLGEETAPSCGHCDLCAPKVFQPHADETHRIVSEWISNRSIPIEPSKTYRLSEGFSLLDGMMRSPLFVRFMKERAVVSTCEEMDEKLIELLLRKLGDLVKTKRIGGIIPLPSRSWKAQQSLLDLISRQLGVPILHGLLRWKEPPSHRQGELLNNDQRHHNVHLCMEIDGHPQISKEPLILFDDYIGSGNTIREAARVLRKEKNINNELIPCTIAQVKWHLGKPGFC